MPTAAAGRESRMLRDLRVALQRDDRLSVLYMPVVDLTTLEMTGVEALVRWDDPDLGKVSPSDFVPVAERNGLATDLGDRVRAIVMADLQAGRLPAGDVALNVSGLELGDAAFPDRLLDLLERSGVAPSTLTLEVTETALAADLGRAAEALLRLRAAGFLIAIDDFGTGHASLEYLASLPCDVVKIDRRFITGLVSDQRCTAIVRGVVGMAHGLGLTVIAEGVETAVQHDHLAGLDCDRGQGHLFGRPVTCGQLATPGAGMSRRAAPVPRLAASQRTGDPSRAQTLLDLGADLENCTDLQEALDRTLEAVRACLVFTGGSIQLVGHDGIRLAAAHPPPTAEALASRLPPGQGVGWGIVTARELRYLPDITAPTTSVPSRRRKAATTRHTRSYLGVPLLVAGEAIGLLQVDSVDEDAFDADDQLLLSGCAFVLAALIDRRRWARQVKGVRAR